MYGISPNAGTLADADTKFRSGPNDKGETGSFGPRPSAGHGRHHYHFFVYALNTQVEATPDRAELLNRYAGNVSAYPVCGMYVG